VFVDEHAEALEADQLRHYGVDLLDWHRGRLTSRRLAVLVRHLPRDSSTLREIHGEAADWSAAEHLLAAAVDRLSEANWMFATVNRDEDADPPDYPGPVPRPVPPATTDEAGADGTGSAGAGTETGAAGRGGESFAPTGGPVPDVAPTAEPDGLENAAARLPSAAELARFFA
jgi:hypothetical protein